MKIREANTDELETLVDVWLRSVRATHKFLTEADIQNLLPVVREQALPGLELWVLVDDDGSTMGFMGLSGSTLEALFLAPESTRRGGGRMMLEHARTLRGALCVDVNEQNVEATRFYLANGFVVVGRSEVDDAGRPFPLLHMREASE